MVADLREPAHRLGSGWIRAVRSALQRHGDQSRAARRLRREGVRRGVSIPEKKRPAEGGGGSLEGGVLRCYVISEGGGFRRATGGYCLLAAPLPETQVTLGGRGVGVCEGGHTLCA